MKLQDAMKASREDATKWLREQLGEQDYFMVDNWELTGEQAALLTICLFHGWVFLPGVIVDSLVRVNLTDKGKAELAQAVDEADEAIVDPQTGRRTYVITKEELLAAIEGVKPTPADDKDWTVGVLSLPGSISLNRFVQLGAAEQAHHTFWHDGKQIAFVASNYDDLPWGIYYTDGSVVGGKYNNRIEVRPHNHTYVVPSHRGVEELRKNLLYYIKLLEQRD